MPHEKYFNKYNEVWNLSKDKGNVGKLYITNVRVVWISNDSPNFNISIPYIQIKTIKLKKSKTFGEAMVIATIPPSGSYYLGF